MQKLNTKDILHNEAIHTSDNIYDDSVNWDSDTNCDWCPLTMTCPYSNIDMLNEKRSCFVYAGDTHIKRYKVFLLVDNTASANRLCSFYTGRCYD